MKYNLLKDVSNITRLRTSVMNTLTDVAKYCICDYIDNLKINDEEVVEIDVGIGTLFIEVLDEEVKYQFKPSTNLERSIVSTIVDEDNPLTRAAELNLEKRIYNTYKGLL